MKSKIKLLRVVMPFFCCSVFFSCDEAEDDLGFSEYAAAPEEYYDQTGDEQYNVIDENPFVSASEFQQSTFSIDADGASYANMRRFLSQGLVPFREAIRTEELINYFTFDYAQTGNEAVSINGEIAECPWNEGHQLLRLGIKGKDLSLSEEPASNYILLIDVSGSMGSDNKLGLLKSSFNMYVNEMKDTDRMSIVTYAGSSAILLRPTSGDEKSVIKQAINSLGAGGSTAGAAGIRTAYELAEESFIPGGNNRIIIGTDGDFNVGISSQEELINLIKEKRDRGVFLTVLGVGEGNLQEGTLEQIANNGDGNFEYIDNLQEARKIFIDEKQKFVTVAKDVKVQVTFDTTVVNEYRLIGYENRLLSNEEFENEDADAGEIGASQTITALYEIIPNETGAGVSSELALFNVKFKDVAAGVNGDLNMAINNNAVPFSSASENIRFAASLAATGLYLRESAYRGTVTLDQIKSWTKNAIMFDPNGYRVRHLDLLNDMQ